MRRNRAVAFHREAEDLLADAVRRRIGVHVVPMVGLFSERLTEGSRRRVEGRMQMIEGGEIVADHDHVNRPLHFDVVVEDRGRRADRKLAHFQRRRKAAAHFRPKLRNDLRRAA